MRHQHLRVGVLVSGGGRSVLNLYEAIACDQVPARIEVVICSRPAAAAVERCRAAGLRVEVVDRAALAPRDYQDGIGAHLRAARAELVVMAGFLSQWHIPPDFTGRVINIHPALLPAFGGKGYYGDRVHGAVLAAGATESGCTVHYADDQYDHGPIILQRRVPVFPGDTPQTLADRVFVEERIALPQVVRMFAEGQLDLPYRPR